MNRVILFGRIDYKNKRAITFARDEYIRFYETKAKGDSAFKPEDIFGEDLEADIDVLHLEFERKIHEASNKTLSNTLNGMRMLMQFAIAGRMDLFVLEAGELPRQEVLLVDNDKTVVHAYNAGMEALEEERYEDAIGPLTDAIAKFASHPWAHDARGLAYLELGKLDEAEADFKSAREIYRALPSPHLGLAKIAHARGERAATIDNCDRAMKGSIPHQPGHWISALFKARVLMDSVEEGKGDAEEVRSYLSIAKTILERYASKLRQLGSAWNSHYPSEEELEALQARLTELRSAATADA